MAKQIEVLKFIVTDTPGKRPYKVAEVAYKSEGKTKGMKVLDFVQREVFQTLVSINPQPGDILDVEFSQNDKGFWQFASVAKGEKVSSSGTTASAGGGSQSRGNWETSEERAKRQVMIVRQSSLSTAVALAESNKAKVTVDDVIATAKIFEAYVMGTETVTGDEVV